MRKSSDAPKATVITPRSTGRLRRAFAMFLLVLPLIAFSQSKKELEERRKKLIRDIVAEQFENNDKLQERLAKLESIVGELNATAYSHIRRFEALERTTSNNLSLRLISLEESVHNCVTRKEARDVAYETVRDADLDELLGSYVKDKVEEVLNEDDRYIKDKVEEVLEGDYIRDQIHDLVEEKLERVEISLNVV